MEKVFRALAAGMERPTYLSHPKKQVEGAAEAPIPTTNPRPEPGTVEHRDMPSPPPPHLLPFVGGWAGGAY